MARKRLPENNGLPKRWRKTRNAYYYQVPPGMEKFWNGKQTFKLGNTLTEAYKEWANRLELLENPKTIGELLDKYLLDVVPNKAIKTQHDYQMYITKVRKVFGSMFITDIKPHHIYAYVDKRSKKKIDSKGKRIGGLTIAKREMAMFTDSFTYAVRLGLIDRHPFKNEVKYEAEKARTRYIENWELKEFLSLAPKRQNDPTYVIHGYTALKLLTGLRQQDLLSLTTDNLGLDGIHVTPLKTINSTGKSIIIKWTPALHQALSFILSVRPVQKTPYLFCTRQGGSYYHPKKSRPATGWQSIWKRYMQRVLKETALKDSFTEHDLRAKTSSDLEDLLHAQKLLAHSNSSITKRVYRRKPETVAPAR